MKPNIYPQQLNEMGLLPIKNKPVRFAIGAPDGLTSNSWRVWTTKYGDIYISCRDNFTEAKVSLHKSGRWRMGFTTQAIEKNPEILGNFQDRAWEVWDKPNESFPNIITAFQLIFIPSELAVSPEKRIGKKWKDVIYIEGPPEDKLVSVSILITKGDIDLKHETEPGFCLASYAIQDGFFAKVFAHGEPINDFIETMEQAVRKIVAVAKSKGTTIPKEAYVYFYGTKDEVRYISGARANR